MQTNPSQFKAVFNDVKWTDDFYRFLQVVFHLYPEHKFHQLIMDETFSHDTDEEIYKSIQNKLQGIKPFLSEITYALPALKKQKKEIARQTLQLLGDKKQINGYVEIGSTGRYISQLKKQLGVNGDIYLINDLGPTNSPADIMERGQISKIGKFINLNNYNPIASTVIPDESVDLITCNIGLHHCPVVKLDGFLKSIYRILRMGGAFIIRDHNVKSPEMASFVSLVHTVFNVGLNESWDFEMKDFKNFKSVAEWSDIITKIGFNDAGLRLLQDKDPSYNTLMLFTKP